MGQRHQVFLVTSEGKFAWHSQWCYGTLPLRHLQRILQYEEKTEKRDKDGWGGYSSLTNPKASLDKRRCVEALISLDWEDASFSRYTDITDETKVNVRKNKDGFVVSYDLDFEMTDNNDGLTIIDTRTYPIKYCYLFYAPGDPGCQNLYTPLSAREYFALYEEDYGVGKSYGEELRQEALTIIDYIDQHSRVITIPQLIKMFPASMKGLAKERRLIQQTKLEDLPALINNDFTYPVNEKLITERLNKAA